MEGGREAEGGKEGVSSEGGRGGKIECLSYCAPVNDNKGLPLTFARLLAASGPHGRVIEGCRNSEWEGRY